MVLRGFVTVEFMFLGAGDGRGIRVAVLSMEALLSDEDPELVGRCVPLGAGAKVAFSFDSLRG